MEYHKLTYWPRKEDARPIREGTNRLEAIAFALQDSDDPLDMADLNDVRADIRVRHSINPLNFG